VRAQSSLTLILDPKGAATPVQVSLSGSSNALDALKKCAKVAAPTEFFKQLNGKKDELVADLGDHSVLLVFQTVQKAYDAVLAGRSINAELAALRKPSLHNWRRRLPRSLQ
jgi:hypothetical protein